MALNKYEGIKIRFIIFRSSLARLYVLFLYEKYFKELLKTGQQFLLRLNKYNGYDWTQIPHKIGRKFVRVLCRI